MSGRGDNNKHGSSGRGASNQSNQALGSSADRKSNHGQQTGGQRSEPQHKKVDQASDRNLSRGKQ